PEAGITLRWGATALKPSDVAHGDNFPTSGNCADIRMCKLHSRCHLYRAIAVSKKVAQQGFLEFAGGGDDLFGRLLGALDGSQDPRNRPLLLQRRAGNLEVAKPAP